MNLRKRHLAIASIIAMVGALAFVTALLWSSGWVHAQGGSLPEPPTIEPFDLNIQARPLTDVEWNEIKPRTAQQRHGTETRTAYDATDYIFPDAGATITWGTPPGLIGFRVERRIVEPDGAEHSWRLMKRMTRDTDMPDADGAPGFSFDYLITATTTSGKITQQRRFTMWSRDKVYGIGVSQGVELTVVPHATNLDAMHRVRRYSSPSSETFEEIESAIPDEMIPDYNVTGGYHKYVVDYVVYNPDTNQHDRISAVGSVVLKAGRPTPRRPRSLISFSGENSGQVDVTWYAPSGDRADFALYEVMRRDARDQASEFKVIASTLNLRYRDISADTANSYYMYAIRTAGWAHDHSSRSGWLVIPDLPAPTCTLTQQAGGGGRTKPVSNIELKEPWGPPTDNGYGVAASFAWLDPDANSSNNKLVYHICRTVNPADWYMQKRTLYAHQVSPNCDDPSISCDVIGGTAGYSDEPWEVVWGRFEEAATRSYQSLVWYDEQNTTPGLYQHRYYVCSYATPQICSEKQKGSWRFVDITSTPFPAP